MRELINTYGCHSLIRLHTHIRAHTQLHKHIFELDYKEERQWEESGKVCVCVCVHFGRMRVLKNLSFFF